MPEFFLGGQTVAAMVAGLFFLRFWRATGEPLLLCFAAAFFLLSLNWLLLAFADRDEPNTALYSARLGAFALIMLGIWFKNRRGREPRPSAPAEAGVEA